MKIIKRSGKEDVFDVLNHRCNQQGKYHCVESEQLTPAQIEEIAQEIERRCESIHRAVDVETIQDWVEVEIMQHGAYLMAKNYITYRYERGLQRQSNTTEPEDSQLAEF